MNDLQDLLGSVLTEEETGGTPPAPPPLHVHATGESGGESATSLPSTSPAPPSAAAATVPCHLLYITSSESRARCMGYIGRTKFCTASACTIQKHDTTKFHPAPGLYIRVPKKVDQCFCSPCLADNLFDSDLASSLLGLEHSMDDWANIFATITKQGRQVSAEQWQKLSVKQERIKDFTTPRKTQKSESLASLNLSSIGDSLKDIKNEVQQGRDSQEVNFRLEKLEAQIELIGERLEEWALDQKFKELHREEQQEDLQAFLTRLETQIGRIPPHAAEQLETSKILPLGRSLCRSIETYILNFKLGPKNLKTLFKLW